jgi:hypothetical protein
MHWAGVLRFGDGFPGWIALKCHAANGAVTGLSGLCARAHGAKVFCGGGRGYGGLMGVSVLAAGWLGRRWRGVAAGGLVLGVVRMGRRVHEENEWVMIRSGTGLALPPAPAHKVML